MIVSSTQQQQNATTPIRLRNVFTGVLPSNERPSIVGWALVGTGLSSCSLTTDILVHDTLYFVCCIFEAHFYSFPFKVFYNLQHSVLFKTFYHYKLGTLTFSELEFIQTLINLTCCFGETFSTRELGLIAVTILVEYIDQ
jgi:hypothetical protein